MIGQYGSADLLDDYAYLGDGSTCPLCERQSTPEYERHYRSCPTLKLGGRTWAP